MSSILIGDVVKKALHHLITINKQTDPATDLIAGGKKSNKKYSKKRYQKGRI